MLAVHGVEIYFTKLVEHERKNRLMKPKTWPCSKNLLTIINVPGYVSLYMLPGSSGEALCRRS